MCGGGGEGEGGTDGTDGVECLLASGALVIRLCVYKMKLYRFVFFFFFLSFFLLSRQVRVFISSAPPAAHRNVHRPGRAEDSPVHSCHRHQPLARKRHQSDYGKLDCRQILTYKTCTCGHDFSLVGNAHGTSLPPNRHKRDSQEKKKLLRKTNAPGTNGAPPIPGSTRVNEARKRVVYR